MVLMGHARFPFLNLDDNKSPRLIACLTLRLFLIQRSIQSCNLVPLNLGLRDNRSASALLIISEGRFILRTPNFRRTKSEIVLDLVGTSLCQTREMYAFLLPAITLPNPP